MPEGMNIEMSAIGLMGAQAIRERKLTPEGRAAIRAQYASTSLTKKIANRGTEEAATYRQVYWIKVLDSHNGLCEAVDHDFNKKIPAANNVLLASSCDCYDDHPIITFHNSVHNTDKDNEEGKMTAVRESSDHYEVFPILSSYDILASPQYSIHLVDKSIPFLTTHPLTDNLTAIPCHTLLPPYSLRPDMTDEEIARYDATYSYCPTSLVDSDRGRMCLMREAYHALVCASHRVQPEDYTILHTHSRLLTHITSSAPIEDVCRGRLPGARIFRVFCGTPSCQQTRVIVQMRNKSWQPARHPTHGPLKASNYAASTWLRDRPDFDPDLYERVQQPHQGVPHRFDGPIQEIETFDQFSCMTQRRILDGCFWDLEHFNANPNRSPYELAVESATAVMTWRAGG